MPALGAGMEVLTLDLHLGVELLRLFLWCLDDYDPAGPGRECLDGQALGLQHSDGVKGDVNRVACRLLNLGDDLRVVVLRFTIS